MSQYPGIVIERTHFTRLFASAWAKAITESNIRSGFRACGIYPYNCIAVLKEAFLPNAMYNISTVIEDTVEQNNNATNDRGDNIENNSILMSPCRALKLLETSMTPDRLTSNNFLYSKSYNLDADERFMSWKALKQVVPSTENIEVSIVHI